MKVNYKLPASVLGLLFLLTFLNPSVVKAQNDDVSLETFYEELSPYGVWINDPQYGRVWRPDVDQDEFRPYYSKGHWEMTRYGNTWVSDYDWGWAAFHYGRWHYTGRMGWLWIPDTHWGPAWVSWRSGGGHYGWAPLGPGINLNMSIGRIPDFYWVFVPQSSIYYSRYPGYDSRRNLGIYHNTVIINNTYVYNQNRYYTGPRAEEIRRLTRQPVTIHDVRNQRPDPYANQNNRPEVSRITNSGRSENTVTEKPGTKGNTRPGDQHLPASSQRSGRTYDNQESRASQSQRQTLVERQSTAPSRNGTAQREQSNEQRRPVRQATAPQPQVSSNGSGQQRSGQSRSSEAQHTDSERSSSQGRPSRVQ